MSRLKIYSVLLAFASLFLYAVQPAWAFTEVSAVNAYNAVSAGNGVIIDVRSVEEHNGCNAKWSASGLVCPTSEAANRGAPQWKDPDTGVWMQAAVIPWWIDTIGNFTSPQNVTEFRASFQALLDSGYITKNSPVYLLCRSGARSRAASGWIEANMGFTNVHNIDGDGTGSNDGGMLEWTKNSLPVAWNTAINRGWKAPQIFSITPVDGTTETASNTITFNYGILEPTWGWLYYGDIVRISLYMDGKEVAFTTVDPTTGALWTTGSFTYDVSNGTHKWDIRAEAKVLTPSGSNIFDFNRLAGDLGPGGRSITVNVSSVVSDQNISVSPLTLNFDSVTLGDTSAAQTVTVKNTGDANLNIGAVTINGDFSITGDTCSGSTVTAGSNCTVNVVFKPSTSGTLLIGTLSIPSDDPDTPNVDVALSGTGLAVSTTPEQNISVTPTALDFGSVVVGTDSAPQTVTVTNTGKADLTVTGISLTGDTDAFSLKSTTCTDPTLAPEESCSADIIFTPVTVGDKTGIAAISSNDPDTGVVDVELSGTGIVEQPEITVAPTSVDFGTVTVGDSDSQVVTVTNDGTLDLNIFSVSLLSDPFSTTDDGCTGTLAPTVSCAVTVNFAPTAVGTFSDSLVITSDDSDEATVTVGISGKGAEVSANQPPTKPELLYPENGTTGVPTSDLPLVWKKATDPDNDPVTYEVTYCKDENLTDGCVTVPVNDTTASAKGTSSPMFAGLGAGAGLLLFGFVFALIGMMILTAMFLVSCGDVTTDNTTGTVISGLDTNTNYYWQVTASDGQSGTSSAVWNFKTESGTSTRRGMR